MSTNSSSPEALASSAPIYIQSSLNVRGHFKPVSYAVVAELSFINGRINLNGRGRNSYYSSSLEITKKEARRLASALLKMAEQL